MNKVESLLNQYARGEGPLLGFDDDVINQVLKEYGIEHSYSY